MKPVGFLTIDEGDVEDVAERVERLLPGAHVSRVAAAERFVALLEDLMPSGVPAPAFVDQARRNAELRWQLLEEFGALDGGAVHELSGSRSKNTRQTASRWQRDGRIFAVEHKGQLLYPGFQFDRHTGQPKAAVADVLAALPEGMRGWELATWWTDELDGLEGRRPVVVLDGDPEAVIAAAGREAREWAFAVGEDVCLATSGT